MLNANIWLRTIGYGFEIAAVFLIVTNRQAPGAVYAAYALFAIGFAFILAAYIPWRRRPSQSAPQEEKDREAKEG